MSDSNLQYVLEQIRGKTSDLNQLTNAVVSSNLQDLGAVFEWANVAEVYSNEAKVLLERLRDYALAGQSSRSHGRMAAMESPFMTRGEQTRSGRRQDLIASVTHPKYPGLSSELEESDQSSLDSPSYSLGSRNAMREEPVFPTLPAPNSPTKSVVPSSAMQYQPQEESREGDRWNLY